MHLYIRFWRTDNFVFDSSILKEKKKFVCNGWLSPPRLLYRIKSKTLYLINASILFCVLNMQVLLPFEKCV